MTQHILHEARMYRRQQSSLNATPTKQLDSDSDDAPPPIALWDKCQHIKALIKDLYADIDVTNDKNLRDLAIQLNVNKTNDSRSECIVKIHSELLRYFSQPMRSNTSSRRESDEEPPTGFKVMVDFKRADRETTKNQFIDFVVLAGNERGDKKVQTWPPKDVMKKIDQMFDPTLYRKEDEYIITNPLKLEWHFPQQYILQAAVKYQYRIIWKTRDGMPESMSLWQLPSAVTSQLRKEFVQLDFFRHLKGLPENLKAYDLCPPIYARLKRPDSSAVYWQKTAYDHKKKDFFTKPAVFPDWITDDDLEVKLVRKTRNKKMGIESFFFKAALDNFELGEHLQATNIVYYFVIHDKEIADFQDQIQPIEGLHPTQVYVGKAKNGILDRWVERSSSHCQLAYRLCQHMYKERLIHDQYKPSLFLQSPSLLESYLALAKAHRYKCAVFVLYDLENEAKMSDMENDLIVHHQLTNMHRGLNEKRQ